MAETEERGAELGARLASVAATQEIDARPLLPLLEVLEPELERAARVTLSHSFSRMAVGCAWPAELEASRRLAAAHHRLAAHGPGFEAQAKRLPALAGNLDARVSIAAATIPRRTALSFAIRVERARTLDDALVALVKQGELTQIAREQVAEAAALAGLHVTDAITDWCFPPALRLWSFHFDEGPDRERSRILTSALDLARGFGVDAEQRKLIGAVHKLFSTAGRASVALVACADGLLPRVRVEYRGVRAPAGAHVMEHLFPEVGGARRVGALAGALGVDHVASADIGFGDFDRPSACVSADLIADGSFQP